LEEEGELKTNEQNRRREKRGIVGKEKGRIRKQQLRGPISAKGKLGERGA